MTGENAPGLPVAFTTCEMIDRRIYRMDLTGKRILVIGSGISGIAAVKLLNTEGIVPVLLDGNTSLTQEDLEKRLPEGTVAECIVGELPEDSLARIDIAVLSPGVPVDSPQVLKLKEQGALIWGEIELAYQFEKGKVLAVTGTNGKTTTTSLLGAIMKAHQPEVFVVGNIGIPYTEVVKDTTEHSVTVVEISSFQLETTHEFAPVASSILNITPDHLDRHHTMENYVAAKERIACNQTKEQACVLNYEDAYTKAFADSCSARVIFFSSARELKDGFYLKNDEIMKAVDGHAERLMNIHDMKLLGTHNVENVMAAIAMADSVGVDMDTIIRTVCGFEAVEHRIEFVATKKGVDYYNDSKGTNPDAAIKGIQAMVKPTYLIGGGYDKKNTYDEWIESFDGKVKKLILLGQTREKIAQCAKEHGFTDYLFVESLQEAVDYCAKEAKEGDAVLLSPACASWGMFKNYEVRGQMFKEMVKAL